MTPSRFPIITFGLVGLFLVLTNRALIRGLTSLAAGPHRHFAGILAEAFDLVGPGLWLLAVAFGLLLTTGSATPVWTRGHWSLATAVLYLFHIPLILPLTPTAVFGRWGFTVYLFLGSVGTVGALRLLNGRFHFAAFFLLAEPIVRNISWMHLHHAARSLVMALFSVIAWALIGWWFRDAASSCRPNSPQGQVPRTPAIADGQP